jgi:transcriptional regulator with XRE-family HTH domain
MEPANKKYERFVLNIARNVVRVRKSKGLTQEQMVDLGYSYRHYQRVESGKHSPNLNTLFRLAETFKVDIREFFK